MLYLYEIFKEFSWLFKKHGIYEITNPHMSFSLYGILIRTYKVQCTLMLYVHLHCCMKTHATLYKGQIFLSKMWPF